MTTHLITVNKMAEAKTATARKTAETKKTTTAKKTCARKRAVKPAQPKHIGIVSNDTWLEPFEDAIRGRHEPFWRSCRWR